MRQSLYEHKVTKNPLIESSFVRDTRGGSREETLFGLALVAFIISAVSSSFGFLKFISVGLSFGVGGPAALLFVVLGLAAWFEMIRRG